MKKNILLLSLCGAMALAWTSCTDTVDYIAAEAVKADCPKMSFTKDNQFYEFTPTDPNKVTLTVTRENTDADVTVPLVVLKNDGDVFNIPESVSFNAGQSSVDFDVEFPDVVVGQVYSFDIALPAEYVDSYSTSVLASCGYSVQCIQWDDLGVGPFNSNMFGASWEQPVYKASHTDLYKFPSLYSEGLDILVNVSGTSAQVSEQLSFVHNTYGDVYVSGSGELKDKVLTMKLKFYCSAGSFGEYIETYTFK